MARRNTLEAGDDVVLVHGPTDDGEGARVIRKRGDELSVGELRAAPEGKPLHGDLVKLSPREGEVNLFNVEVVHETKPVARQRTDRKGPPRVSNETYRKNWQTIFGSAKKSLPN